MADAREMWLHWEKSGINGMTGTSGGLLLGKIVKVGERYCWSLVGVLPGKYDGVPREGDRRDIKEAMRAADRAFEAWCRAANLFPPGRV